MRKSITINIPKPCHEDWNNMSPTDRGRHCAVCQKTVIDFTQQTDEQIVKVFETNGNLCGRFKKQQLHREVVLNRKSKNSYLSWAASGLFAFLALNSQRTSAQNKPKIVNTDNLKTPQIKGKTSSSVLNDRTISGNVTSESDGLPLPGVNVIVKGTTKGTHTDFDGNFTIRVKYGDVLVFSYLGFETFEIPINKNAQPHTSLKMVMQEDLMGDVVVGLIVTDHDIDLPSYISEEEAVYKRKQLKNNHESWKKKNKAQRTQWKAERLAKRAAIKSGKQERTAIGKFFYYIKRIFTKKK